MLFRSGPEASAAKTKALAGDVVTGVGIAAAAAGVVVLVVQRSGAHKPATAWITPWGEGAVGGLRIRF